MRRLTGLIVVGTMAALLCTSATWGEDMGGITCGQIRSGTITSPGETDRWTFTAQEQQRVFIDARGTSPGFVPRLGLYPPGGGPPIALEYAYINIQLPASGTYAIAVYDYDGTRTGSYTISMYNLQGCRWPELPCGQSVEGSIDDVSEFDIYQFDGEQGETVFIDARGTSGGFVPRLGLYPPGGGESLAVEYEYISIQLPVSGTYAIAVYDYAATRTGSYTISVYNLQGCQWPEISCGQIIRGSIDTVSELDVYQFDGQQGNRVFIDARGTSPGFVPRLGLYRPGGGEPIALEYEYINIQLPESGTYALAVYDYDAAKTGSYTIGVYNLQGCPWPEIPCGQTIQGSIDAVSEFDIYRFDGEQGGRVFIDARGTSPGFVPRLGLYPPGGGESLAVEYEYISIQLPVSGTYALAVYDYDAAKTGSYSLELECEGPPKPDLTISSASVSPNPVFEPQSATVNWTIKNAGTAEAPGGHVIKVRLSADGNYDESDLLLCETPIHDVLAPGGVLAGTCTLSTTSVEPGGYWVVAKVDATNVLSELEENNNTASAPATIRPRQCTLTILPTAGGSTTPDAGSHSYSCGDLVPVAASPDQGYKFSGWMGTAVDEGKVGEPQNPGTTVLVDEDYTLKANFEAKSPFALPQVKTIGVEDVTSISARLMSTLISDGNDVCEWRFRYQQAGQNEPSYTDWHPVAKAGEAFKEFIESLAPQTGYCFEAEARNRVGIAKGGETCFTTPDYVRLTLSSTAGGRIIEPNVPVVILPAPADVNVVAEADPDCFFWCWQGTAVEGGKVLTDVTEPNTTAVVDANDTLRAVFLRWVPYWADDVNCPVCRGASYSTSQLWDFADDAGDVNGIPEGLCDILGPAPNGQPPRLGTLLTCEDPNLPGVQQWWPSDPYESSGRRGLVASSGLRASINIWPSPEGTSVWLQIVWREFSGAQPELDPSDAERRPLLMDVEPFLGMCFVAEFYSQHGWFHTTYVWLVEPDTETVHFTIGGPVVIDSLLVDTCTENWGCWFRP